MRFSLILYLILLILGVPSALANSSSTGEARAIKGLGETVRQYRTYIEDVPVTSWDQIAKIDVNLYGINAGFKDEDPSELYSFISVGERSKFPDGELILIRYEPIAFPDAYKNRYAEGDARAIEDAENPNYKPIRYLLYRDKKGEMQSFWWYEDRVQEMLKETGIKIPDPERFTNYIDPNIKHSERRVVEAVEGVDEPALPQTPDKEPGEVPTAETSEEFAEESSNWWIWLIGVLVITGGVGLMVSRKKS